MWTYRGLNIFGFPTVIRLILDPEPLAAQIFFPDFAGNYDAYNDRWLDRIAINISTKNLLGLSYAFHHKVSSTVAFLIGSKVHNLLSSTRFKPCLLQIPNIVKRKKKTCFQTNYH